MTVYAKETKKKTRWYYQVMVNRQYRRGGGYLTKREAQEAEVAERNSLSPNPRMAFGEVCDRYLTFIKDYKQSKAWVYQKTLVIKNRFSKWFTLPIGDITPQIIEDHLIERGIPGNSDLKFLSAIMNFAKGKAWIGANPCGEVKKLPTEEKLKYIPPIEDFMAVYMVAPPIEKRLLILLFCTAARVSEVLALKKEDITSTHLILRSRKHKEGKMRERRIPLNPIMREAIDFLKTGQSEYLFENKREETRYLRRPKLMHSLCKKARVKPFGFHSIRHLATSVLVNQKEDLQTLKDLLGHAKITTTQIYIHSIEDSLTGATEKLGQIFNNNSIKNLETPKKSPENTENVHI